MTAAKPTALPMIIRWCIDVKLRSPCIKGGKTGDQDQKQKRVVGSGRACDCD
jgi:hypothetical protein